jgi:phosphatidylglycerol lysyltransferase
MDTKRKLVKNAGAIISVCLFIVAAVVIHHELKAYHVHDITRQVEQVPYADLVAAFVFTVLNYLVLTGSDALALRYVRHPLAYHRLAFASFVGYVFSNNVTIVGGSAARYRIYSALGVSANKLAEVVLFCGVTFWLGFLALAGVVLVVERQALPVPQQLHWPFHSVWMLGVVFLLLIGVYILVVALRRRPLNIRGWQLPVPSPALAAGQIGVSALDWLLAAAVLYVLLPNTLHVTFVRFLGLFMLAQAAGLLSYIPGGLGVFETVLLLSLTGGGDAAALAAALILYRFIYYFLPLTLGALMLTIHELLPQMPAVKRLGIHIGRWGSIVAPQIFAFAVFVTGAVLLFSGALPPVRGRVEVLRDLLPLPAIELSHFLGSLTGAALLILARGLQRRLDGAYHLTILLLAAGIGFSLLKGLDYEEATILGVMLAALLPCRRQFYRKASLTAQRFSPGWMALILIVLVCSVWLGLFAYKHVEYTHDLWWRFTFRGDAPRFLRATAGAVVLILLYAGARLLVPTQPKPETLDETTLAKVHDIVAASTKTYACLALLGDKQFVLGDAHDAFIMYGVESRTWVALGDPVGPQEHWEDLAWKFLEICDRYDGQPAFYQVDAQGLDLYTNLGLTFLKLGEEARVPLDSFSLEGNARKGLRHSYNKVAKENYTFRILPADQVPAILDSLKRVSDAWLHEKNTREKGFSLGFFDPAYISRCPVAVVDGPGGIVAFANLWQVAGNEELSVDLMRHLPSCPEGIMDYLFIKLMLWGKEQGYQWFNLGMAPLSGLESRALAPFWTKAGALLFRRGEHFYNFQGLRQYKDKFGPQWRPKYLACRGGLALPRILTNIATLISGGLAGIVKK